MNDFHFIHFYLYSVNAFWTRRRRRSYKAFKVLLFSVDTKDQQLYWFYFYISPSLSFSGRSMQFFHKIWILNLCLECALFFVLFEKSSSFLEFIFENSYTYQRVSHQVVFANFTSPVAVCIAEKTLCAMFYSSSNISFLFRMRKAKSCFWKHNIRLGIVKFWYGMKIIYE